MRDFRILGPLEVVEDGRPLALGGPRQRALLALLLIRAGRVVPTEQIVDELWGEQPPPTAVASLQNAVSALRKLLGPETVVTRPPGYALIADPACIDSTRFERMLEEARGAMASERVEALRRAEALWRGPALADFRFESWARGESGRMEELRVAAVGERIDAEIELGRHAEVVGELEGLVREYPLRERLREQHMLALYRAGRQGDALQAYRDARTYFVGELGIEPGTRLQDLHASILRQEAGLTRTADRSSGDVEGEIVRLLLSGRLVPVIGLAGAGDLAADLASTFGYATNGHPLDLARVSQYVATLRGSGPLYDELHARYEAATEPTAIHRTLAALPRVLRERGVAQPLVVTTNYDLALERAFEEQGEELDVVAYVSTGEHRGKFWHRAPGAPPQPIEVPNTYASELSLDRRPILLKLRGAIDPLPDREWESFVITEDDHIDYLLRADLTSVVPVGITAKLRRSHFLFLGFEMADWNLRLILARIWGSRPVAYASWAVHAEASDLERAFWRRSDVEVIDLDPDAFAELLSRRLEDA